MEDVTRELLSAQKDLVKEMIRGWLKLMDEGYSADAIRQMREFANG